MRPMPNGPPRSRGANPPSQAPPAGPPIPADEVGMLPSVKNLYEDPGSRRRGGPVHWVDKYPDDLLESPESDETARHALLIRNKRCYDGEKQLEVDSIVVQSPLLRECLGRVLKDYPGITPGLKKLTFSAPFQPFFYRWEELVGVKGEVDREEDGPKKKHMNLFFETIQNELKETVAAKADLIAHKVITFEHLWTIFRTGELIYTKQNGRDCCVRLKSGQYANTFCGRFYQLSCETVDWDGRKFGRGSTSIALWDFEGTMEIEELSAYPFEYHPSREAIKEKLLLRGKKFEALRGFNYKSYSGVALGKPPRWGAVVKYQVDSRVIVDTHAYVKFNTDDDAVNLQPLVERKGGQQGNTPYNYYPSGQEEGEDVEPEHRIPLTEEQLLIANPMVRGYAMKNKKWMRFFVDLIREISWSDRAFESLVLPSNQKELILAFAESQLQCKKTFDDVIQGKGKGIIMLLSGSPGVGKTLTAESVAETMRAPLYTMSAGDLGLNPDTVEHNLSTILEMATKWNAVLLLDEADVFLEQRTPHDLERNKLVSIFLRILEYYEGILFLTTNRVQTFDKAFQSRIHVTINYPELDVGSRTVVWKNFLEMSGCQGCLAEGEVKELAEMRLNGREIKNVVKTALLLAEKRGEGLKREHIGVVMSVMENIQV